MRYLAQIIFQGLLAAFLVFMVAELLKPGLAANFISLGALFLATFALSVIFISFKNEKWSNIHPIVSITLTLLVLGGTILFARGESNELGKIGLIITFGAALLSISVLKTLFENKEL